MIARHLGGAAPPPLSPSLFEGLDGGAVHLCSGSEAPLLRSARDAFTAYAAARAEGAAGRARLEEGREDARRRVAALLRVPGHPERIAFTSGAGAGLDVVARSLDWREGDEALTLREEYPSVVLAWRAVASRGVRTVLAEGGDRPEEALLAAVGPRTRLVCVSHVGWRTGLRLDLERLSAGLRARGVLLVVDASHSLGVLPFDARLCDAAVGCGHKFLLGPHGTGVLYWARGDRPAASEAPLGWYAVEGFDASGGEARFALKPGATALEPGNPAFLNLLALHKGLEALERAGLDAIAGHALGLAARLREALEEHGVPCLTPLDRARHGTSVAVPDPHGAALHRALSAAGVIASAGFGRLRVSFHGYNTAGDLAAVLDTVQRSAASARAV